MKLKTTKKSFGHQPLIHISKRADLPMWKIVIFYCISILIALIAGGLLIASLGTNPFSFYAEMLSGCFKSTLAMKAMVRIVVPLLIISLGLSFAFKMKFWNIGAEGQFIMGAVGASAVALHSEGWPAWLTIILMAAAGILLGGLWGLIPAFFKCKFSTNETLLTLMLNYIALYIIQLLRDGIWRDPAAGGFPKIAKFPKNAWIPQLFRMDISWIVALALVIFTFFYMYKSKHGYEISVVGDSQNTARYAGMNVNKVVLRTMFISAGICGLAGMLHVGGEATSHTLSMGIANGVGFTAITVAWLAKLNPFGVVFVSFCFGIIEKGCGVTESTFGLSSSVSDILQGIILFVILGSDFFIRYKCTFRRRKKQEVSDK